MTRFSQFAAPAVLGAALLAGVSGCANHGPDVSADSTMLSEGRKSVTATAPHDGTLTIFDDTSNKTVYTGRVNRGDTIKVDAKDNRVMINDKTAVQQDLVNDHHYQVYFNRSDTADRADTARYPQGTVVQPGQAGGTTVITPGQSTTVVQPQAAPAPSSNAPVVQPAPAPQSTTPPPAPSGSTVVQPDGTTVIQPGASGTTVVQPQR